MTIQQHDAFAVREGQLAPVTCRACGCRLEPADSAGTVGALAWFHFGRLAGRDARGDRVQCIDLPHDAQGFAAVAA